MPGALSSAVRRARGIGKLPTTLGAAELAKISASIREVALFSARVANAEYLEKIQSVAEAVARGEITREAAQRTLKGFLKATGYEPEPGTEGTIQDLSSNARLRLIVRTQSGFARGYGVRAEALQNLAKRPWFELYRREQRKEPRDWPSRWRAAGGRLSKKRFLAPITDPIWTRISDFGHPYPPFAFNSGMWVRSLSDRQAGKKAKRQTKPALLQFDQDTKSAVLVKDAGLKKQLLKDLGPDYHVTKGVLRKKGRS